MCVSSCVVLGFRGVRRRRLLFSGERILTENCLSIYYENFEPEGKTSGLFVGKNLVKTE